MINICIAPGSKFWCTPFLLSKTESVILVCKAPRLPILSYAWIYKENFQVSFAAEEVIWPLAMYLGETLCSVGLVAPLAHTTYSLIPPVFNGINVYASSQSIASSLTGKISLVIS